MRLSEMGFDDRFIEILGKDFELYPHQEEAILKLRQNRNLLRCANNDIIVSDKRCGGIKIASGNCDAVPMFS